MQEPRDTLAESKGRSRVEMGTYNDKQIRVPIQHDDAERIQPLPHRPCPLLPGHAFELCRALVVDGLWEEDDD
jgi:hypothetical protein